LEISTNTIVIDVHFILRLNIENGLTH